MTDNIDTNSTSAGTSFKGDPVSIVDEQRTVNNPVYIKEDPAPAAAEPAKPAEGKTVDEAMETTPAADAQPAEPAKPEGDAEQKPKQETQESVQKRINDLTAKRYAAERRAEQEREARLAAEQKAQELLEQVAKNVDPQVKTTDDEIERRAQALAVQIAQQNEFNKACNNIADSGQKAFADWSEAMQNLAMVGVVGKDANPEFLETAIELKDPHKVLHYLGSNVDEADRVAKLPPKKMALELARLEAQLNQPRTPEPAAPAQPPAQIPVSKAPAPVIPVGGAAKLAALDISDPDISPEDFMILRQQQIEARKNRYRR